ncbi:MAG: hypothetical protein FWC00_05600, partial [Firmicutes bacterium]|nr:hypothetical protein [Bacillota bacterium]
AKRLEPYCGTSKMHIANVTDIAREIREKCNDQYTITILRRVFMRIAKLLCEKHKYDCIVTGENLAQVASQTIQGITTMNDVAGSIPILRPLITYDKSEIIELAKRIGTFEISTEPHEDCCTVFVPSSPITSPSIKKCELEENKISHILCGLHDKLPHMLDFRGG